MAPQLQNFLCVLSALALNTGVPSTVFFLIIAFNTNIYTVHSHIFYTTYTRPTCLAVIENPKWAFVQLHFIMISEWEHLHILVTFQMNYSNHQQPCTSKQFNSVTSSYSCCCNNVLLCRLMQF